MKTYIRHGSGSLQFGGSFYHPNNIYVIKEIESGEATVIDYVDPTPPSYKRRFEFIKECDPLLSSIRAYELEIEMETDPSLKQVLQQKLNEAKESWYGKRKEIRKKIP